LELEAIGFEKNSFGGFDLGDGSWVVAAVFMGDAD
jgi:hypothetical protein